MNGCFIEGKFDKSARPDTVLASSLNSFFGNILETNTGNKHMSMKWRIHDAIGSGHNILFEILPNLNKWMTDGSVATESLAPSSSAKVMGLSHRLKFMFCKLVGAIACRAHPLILFLDDLQCKLCLGAHGQCLTSRLPITSFLVTKLNHSFFLLMVQGQMK